MDTCKTHGKKALNSAGMCEDCYLPKEDIIVRLQIALKEIDRLRNPWISVDDRLPESIGAYLIYFQDDDGFHKIAWAFFTSENKWAGSNFFYKNVTHYAVLPQPPTKESGV